MCSKPPVIKTTLVGENGPLLARLSCRFSKPGHYLPILEPPRIGRPDADAELIRRNNALVRSRAQRVLLVDLSSDQAAAMEAQLPPTVVQRTTEEEFSKESPSAMGTFTWGRDRIGLGLLLALRKRKEIVFQNESSPTIWRSGTSKTLLVVCEEGDEVAQVIAANYAYAIDADFLVMESSDKKRLEDLEPQFDFTDPASVASLRKRMRGIIGLEEPGENVRVITFVTQNLPWGFAFPELPSTHLFMYPDLGISIINALAAEDPGWYSHNSALLIDPGHTPASEIEAVKASLSRSGFFVYLLRETDASLLNVSNALEIFPYELLVISTHCGTPGGWRMSFEFQDSTGLDRTLVADIAASFSAVLGTDKIHVTEFIRFVSVDGVMHDDPEKASKLPNSDAIVDFIRLRDAGLHPTERKTLQEVETAAALRMHDADLLYVPQSLADMAAPIVINNSCSSWHHFAPTFTFANARCYVGTLFPVAEAEAQEIAIRLMTNRLGEPLATALHKTQREVYGGDVRRPYAMVGCHFQRIRVKGVGRAERLIVRLIQALNIKKRSLAESIDDDEKALSIRAYITSIHRWIQQLSREVH